LGDCADGSTRVFATSSRRLRRPISRAGVGRVALWLTSVIPELRLRPLATWLLSTCSQLIPLPALMVGQNLQNLASDARAAKSFADTEKIVDALDTHTRAG
jgi:hypothetical protein